MQGLRQGSVLFVIELDDDTIADFDGWLHRVALNLGGPDGHDDLVQEGRIALWQALHRADPSNDGWAGYVTKAAKGRMLDVVTGRRRLTGQEAAQESDRTTSRGRAARDKIRAFLRANPAATGAEIALGTGLSPSTVSVQRKLLDVDTDHGTPGSLDALKDAGFDSPDPTANLLEYVVQAYMNGQIFRALDVLTTNERKYVILRFWEGYERAELKEAFGYDPVAVWRTAKARLRPVLEEVLRAA